MGMDGRIVLAIGVIITISLLIFVSLNSAYINNIAGGSGWSGVGALFQNGTRPLTANWNAGAYNITASWFNGFVSWSNLQGIPTSFTPSSHSHVLSSTNITDWTSAMDWSYIQNIPLSFTPSAHTHAWSDIVSGVPSFVVNGSSNYFTGHVDWNQINDKPLTFPPSSHTQSFTTISGAINSTQLGTWTHAIISDWTSTMDWTYVQNKPLTFAPSSHTHPFSQIYGTATISHSNISDWGTYINQAILTSSNPTFTGMTLSSSGTTELTIDGNGISDFTFLKSNVVKWTIGYYSASSDSLRIINSTSSANAIFSQNGDLSITGNLGLASGKTVDGIDISAYINQAVLTSSYPTFNGMISNARIIFQNGGKTNDDWISISRTGGSTPANIYFALSYRDDNNTLLWYGYNGATYKNFFDMDFANSEVQFYQNVVVPNLDVQNNLILPYYTAMQIKDSGNTARNIMYLTDSDLRIFTGYSGASKYIAFRDFADSINTFTVDNTGNGIFANTVTGTNGVITLYMSGNYGLTWTQTMPTGVNGMIVIVYNSNAGILSSREYVYTNSAWHWIALT